MAYESDDKMVSHPKHYQLPGGLEVIDIIESATEGLSGIEAVTTGNAIKYILRWKEKNGKQDIEKAIWYLTHLKDHLEKKENDILESKKECYDCKHRDNKSDEDPCIECISNNILYGTKPNFENR